MKQLAKKEGRILNKSDEGYQFTPNQILISHYSHFLPNQIWVATHICDEKVSMYCKDRAVNGVEDYVTMVIFLSTQLKELAFEKHPAVYYTSSRHWWEEVNNVIPVKFGKPPGFK